jgi:hypothetical protein
LASIVPSCTADVRRPASIREINCRYPDHQLEFAIVDLQLVHVRTLQAVARHGSFSRAAVELHLTQPAVSMHVRQLEQGLGLPLLDRIGKRAFPTRAGEVLLDHAARALAELEAGVAMVQRLRGIVAGRVRIGTSASISICRPCCGACGRGTRRSSWSWSPATRRRSRGPWWPTRSISAS